MARVRFISDFRWRPSKTVVIEYPGGTEWTVTRACCDAAVAAGAGREIDPPAAPTETPPEPIVDLESLIVVPPTP